MSVQLWVTHIIVDDFTTKINAFLYWQN